MKAIDLEDRIESLEGTLRELRSQLKSRVAHGSNGGGRIEGLQEGFAEVSERAREALGAVRDTSRKAVKKVEGTIQEKPWLSVLAAAGIGLILGGLLFRKRGGD